ncbi:MAG TPA: ABC transporter substrate-binding protein [Anaerolineae bacterium]|nr:ABC transporter substrate-binding protein [Anaerolineae bacterium]
MRTRLLNSLIILIVLAGCTTPTPAPTALPSATPATVPQIEPSATSVPTATPQIRSTRPRPEATYPARPTATPFKAAEESEEDVFADVDTGLKIRYPNRWMAMPPDQGSSILQYFFSPGGAVIAGVMANPAGNAELKTLGGEIRDAVLGGLQNVKIVSDEADQLADGREAWTSVVTAKREDGTSLKVKITTALNGGRAYTIFVFGSPADFDEQQEDITALITGMTLERPRLYGIPRDQALVLAGGESTNPREYDPATTHGSGDKLLFSGLVSFDPQLNLIPELAASWDISPDGTVYTFHLRPDARFHNGKPVTTYDVIYSWERAADPTTKSDTVLTYLGDIVGVKERNESKADSISGLVAIDDLTLQVTIDAAKPYFLQKLTYPTAFVLDEDNVTSGTEWYRAPNGTGPYRLARWDSFKSLLYERNEDYYLEPAKIPYIIYPLYTGDPLRLYESGDIDVTGIGGNDLPRFQDPDEPMHTDLLNGVSLCTGMIIFDNKQPPFDDPKVRQAFSLAFNRQQYIDIVMQNNALPAYGPLPPGLPGYNTALKGLSYDPEKARQLLAESKYGSADKLPPIVYTSGGHGSDIGSSVSALAQMWQQNLGITITVENVEPDKYSDLIHAGQHGQLFSGGWCADYPDPENFADALFHTGAQQNQGHYSNPQVDALLEQARTERDVAKRMQLYQQAEQQIVDDAAVLFTTHSLSHVLVKPYLQGYVLTPISVPLERYLSLDASKMK